MNPTFDKMPKRVTTIKIDSYEDTAYTHMCRAIISPRHKGSGLIDVCPRCGRAA